MNVPTNVPSTAWFAVSRMKYRSRRGPNWLEACVSAAMVIEKTTPATVEYVDVPGTAKGEGAALDFGNLARGVLASVAADLLKLGAINPLSNAVLDRPEFARGVLARTPLGRIAEPDDISGIVAFLCLPCARHITGQVVAVDGGFLAFGF